MARSSITSVSITPTIKATGLISISTLLYSTMPLFIAWWGVGNPFFFMSVWNVGRVCALLAVMFLGFRRFMVDGEIWKLAWLRCLSWPMLFWICDGGTYALFAWSAWFVDVSITAVLYEVWPVLMIALMGWLFREEARYQRIGPVVYFAFILALGGIAVVVLSKSDAFQIITSESISASKIHMALGILLALAAACIASMTAFGFRWAVDFARVLPDTPSHSGGSRELFAVMMGLALSSLFAIPFIAMIGFARDESFTIAALAPSLTLVPLGSVGATLSWRMGNLMTERLGINVISYFTPLLSLGLLLLFGQVGDVNLSFLFVGAAIIIAANMLVFIQSRSDAQSQGEEMEDIRVMDREIEQVELGLRATIADTLFEDTSRLPPHLVQNMQKVRQSAIRRNPALDTGEDIGLTHLLEYADLRDLQAIICHRSLWSDFEDVFGSKGVVEMRFSQLAELRNSIRHSRTVTEIARRDCEAAILWFQVVLRHNPPHRE